MKAKIKENMDQNNQKESNAHHLKKIWTLTKLKGKKWILADRWDMRLCWIE